MRRRDIFAAGAAGLLAPGAAMAQPTAASTSANPFGFVAPQDDPTFGSIITGRPAAYAVGTLESRHAEVAKAFRLLFNCPRIGDHLAVARYFREIKDKNAGGEPYNQEWAVRANPVITGLFSMTNTMPSSGDQTAWCSAFVSFCLYAAGKPTAFSAISGAYRKYGAATNNPKPGDVVVFADYGESGRRGHGHVAFFLGRTGDNIHVLGGNQRGNTKSTGAVCEATFPARGRGLQLHSFRSVI
jgi:uncharacterized protein (TIGR02594 family)